MKILHLTHTDLRYDNRILKELESLAEVDTFEINALGVKLEEGATHASRPIRAKIKNISLFSSKLSFMPKPIVYFFILLETSFRFFISAIKIRPAIIHCHDTMVLPVGTIIKIFLNCKLIYDAHELESNKNGQSRILSKATLIMEKACWRKIDHLISVSESIISWYNSNLGYKKATLILNSPLINQEYKVDSKRYFHELYNIPNEELVFVYLGYLGKGRSIEEILKVFSSPDISSHVVFVGYGEMTKSISKDQQQYVNIHLHDAIPHDEIVATLKFADVGFCLIENVSLSDYFCLPNKLFEYTFAGVPIIASDFPDISNLVKKYKLGKFCSLNLDSISKVVKEIEQNPPGRITTDLKELGWANQGEKLKNTYFNMMK